ncbi:hypothetical protein B0H10DRAFT_1951520 [Mycena sp. CBHHK59/15]|nr:hypothetical protein B0H10DRAFT_1951520 [Mycena sp. CBHHK59/15]
MPAHRKKRKNHKSVEKLLAVPRYRDLLEVQDNEEEGERGRALVSSAAGWRTELAKWIAETRAAELEETEEPDDNSDTPPTASTSRLPPPKTRKWVKMTLKVLFGGAAKPVRKFTEEEIDHEADLMAALADAEEDARPDDGAIECDDDVYVP